MKKALLTIAAVLFALSLIASDELRRRFMFGAQLLPSPGGVRIDMVFPSSPAAAAGLRSGDVITAINGDPVKRPEDFIAAVKRLEKSSAEVEILRDGKRSNIPLQLVEAPRETSSDYDVVYDSVRANDSLRRTIITGRGEKRNVPRSSSPAASAATRSTTFLQRATATSLSFKD
jgi:predicted metalloprotease with PDZ domain